MATAVNTVEDCMVACGVPIIPLFNGDTPTERVSEQIFLNSFETCLSITIDDVKEAISAFTKLTVTAGRISFQPGIKRKSWHSSSGLEVSYDVVSILVPSFSQSQR